MTTHFVVAYGTIIYSVYVVLMSAAVVCASISRYTCGWYTWLVQPWRLSKIPPVADPKKEIGKEENSKSSFCHGGSSWSLYLYFPGYLWCRGGFPSSLSRTHSVATTMEASPLTQQSRPDTFKPKIVQLYEDLFQVRHNPILILTQFRKKKMKKKNNTDLSFTDTRLRTLRRFLEGILLADSGSGSASCGFGAAQSWYYSQLPGA